jgi:hypothetical protein
VGRVFDHRLSGRGLGHREAEVRDQVHRVGPAAGARQVIEVRPQAGVDAVEVDLHAGQPRGLHLGAAVVGGHRQPAAGAQAERAQGQPHRASAQMGERHARAVERELRRLRAPQQRLG